MEAGSSQYPENNAALTPSEVGAHELPDADIRFNGSSLLQDIEDVKIPISGWPEQRGAF